MRINCIAAAISIPQFHADNKLGCAISYDTLKSNPADGSSLLHPQTQHRHANKSLWILASYKTDELGDTLLDRLLGILGNLRIGW